MCQSRFGRRPETSGHYTRCHRPPIQSQGSHRILERPLIGPFLKVSRLFIVKTSRGRVLSLLHREYCTLYWIFWMDVSRTLG